MKVEAFIIHLARAHARRPQVDRIQDALPIPSEVMDAVDAQQLTDEQIARVYRPGLHRPHYPFPLRSTEIACFLSHRKAWQAILDRGLDAGLVIEDDVALEPGLFPDLLSFVLAHARKDCIVRFPEKARGEAGRVLAHSGPMRLVEPRHPGLGMQAQLVGRDAAKALLAFTERFDRPVDTTVQMRWRHQVRVLRALPIAIGEVDAALGGTTIQGKSKTFGKALSREFRRAAYRVAAKAHNALHQLSM